jgi:hypothetical protein
MLKTITLSVDEKLIEAARERARAEKTTLDEKFRLWLEGYARQEVEGERRAAMFREIMENLKHVSSGG